MARLRIMSANLLFDRARPRSLATAIEDISPDILIVQELGRRSAKVIEDTFPHTFLEDRADKLGVGLAARLPVDATRLAMPARSAWVAALEPAVWTGLERRLTVIGMHASNPINWPWTQSVRDRSKQFRLVAEAAAHVDGPYAVVGDMNATPVWPGYRRLSAIGDDAARLAGTQKRTWSHFTKGPRVLRIDHAFVNGVEVATTFTRSIDGTDHDSLIVDLEV